MEKLHSLLMNVFSIGPSVSSWEIFYTSGGSFAAGEKKAVGESMARIETTLAFLIGALLSQRFECE